MMQGLRAFAGGISFVVATPSVWAYSLVPLLLMLILTAVLGVFGVWGAWLAASQLVGDPATVWGQAGGWLLRLVLALLGLCAAWLAALVLAQPLSAFALEHIARAQERALTGQAPPPLTAARALLLSLRVAVVTGVLGLPPLLALALVGLFVPPAAAVTVPLGFLGGAWLLAWNFVDYPLGLRGVGVRGRLRWVGAHFEAFTAFGLAWATLLLVPGVFLLVLPMGVAGATRLVVASDPESGPRAGTWR